MDIEPAKIEVMGYELLEKIAALPKGGSSCVIYLPPEWRGKRLRVIRIDP
jgi:hypothetical protein